MHQYESGYWPVKPTRENCVDFLLTDVDVATQLEAFFSCEICIVFCGIDTGCFERQRLLALKKKIRKKSDQSTPAANITGQPQQQV